MDPTRSDRRNFLRGATAGAAALTASHLGAAGPAFGAQSGAAAGESARTLVRPPRLRAGDRVGLVNPATAAFDTVAIDVAKDSLAALGLEPVLGRNYFARRGYLAGTDEQRAADIMEFFQDDSIRAIWARGGWGAARVLPHLDYDVIAAHPKVLVGYSDTTALLSGVHRKTGLVTFHGPFPRNRFSANAQRTLLFEAEVPTLSNPVRVAPTETVQTEDRVRTLTPGRARGRIVGGNLSVLTAIVGTPYVHEFDDAILFLEDVNEAVYRVDRMMTQLALSGALSRIRGFVFGRCTDCPPGESHGSLTLEEVLLDHVGPLGVPAFRGTMIGHISRQFTIPLGVEAEIDADAGTIQLIAPAVT
ncbi:MAG: LD-carboxypeptidase [Planctomycetota bacterium]